MYKLRLLNTFLGVDIKLGASLISLLGLLNKVAGIYGILAVFTGGTFAQVSLYVYSVLTLLGFLWGLRSIAQEHPQHTLNFAHAFALDHFVSTAYTALFGVIWWVYTPHDGRREAHSEAQKDILEKAAMTSGLTPEQQKAAAEAVWMQERSFAMTVIVLGWIIKIYFILCLYSFALHLRRGTYKQIAMIREYSANGSSSIRYAHLVPHSLQTGIELEEDPSTPSKPMLPRLNTNTTAPAMVIPVLENEPPTPITAPLADPAISLPFASTTAMMRTRSTEDATRGNR